MSAINRRGGLFRSPPETICKLCRLGIWRDQLADAVWLAVPLGLSHGDCAQRARLVHCDE